MNIFFLGCINNWEQVLVDELKKLGEVDVFDPLAAGFNQYGKTYSREQCFEAIERRIAGKHYDFCLAYTSASWIDSEMLRRLRRYFDTYVNINCNDSNEFDFNRSSRKICREFDLNWTFNKSALPFYEREGADVLFMPYAVPSDTSFHQRIPLPHRQRPLYTVLIGSQFDYRPQFLQLFYVWKIPAVFGAHLPKGEFHRMLQTARTHLVLHGLPGKDFADEASKQAKLRLLECAIHTAAPLCDRYPGISEHFDETRELMAFSSAAELQDIVEASRKHPELTQRIADNFRKRVWADHTWKQRFRTLFERLGLTGGKHLWAIK